MAIHCKSTAPSCSAVAIVFMAVIALLYPAAAQATVLEAQADTRKSLTSSLILGEESLVSTDNYARILKFVCKINDPT